MDDLKHQVEQIKNQFLHKLDLAQTEVELENVRILFLSREGSIPKLMHILKELSPDDKRHFGPLLNELKKESEQKFEEKKKKLALEALNKAEMKKTNFDVTAYESKMPKGSLHPYTPVIELIEDVFISMGYKVAQGFELEDEFHNFEALNIAKNHPARDMQDTFWIDVNRLMRTHTSTVQIREMESQKLPLAILSYGRTFRNEATDASHDFVFMQVEGLLIDKNVSMGNLFATLKIMLQGIFQRDDLDIRIRPGYFPFVEPGIEVDMACPFCTSGCSVCKKTRWIEMGGAGLVHPNVLKACNIDSTEYSGFAFGFGLTRLVMLKYGINDIRLLNSGKLEFLEQF
ncbi:MAG: phenylalanine--tRNA ligase subunit alpha [Candidatus Babeliales bacterium]|nr:phenylalanine--tRNA ligase subunit alpha [Candidatus Babeliales bacterium]